MRAVLYCRVSTLEQVENLSLPTQEKACRAYCAREGYAVDAVFIDRGESAKTTDRPEFQAMLAHCRTHRDRLHAVVVYSLSRFSRSSTDHHGIAAILRGLGIALRSVTEPIDDSPAGRLMEGILAAMHQFDNDQKAQRTTAGMKAAIERGRWVWMPPLGYRMGGKREPSLIVVPEVASVLADAWPAIFTRGDSVPDVRARLHAAGIRGRRGKPLSSSSLHAILRAPVYTGRIESPRFGVSERGDWTPLVDAVTFAGVRAKLARIPGGVGPSRRRPRDHVDFPLRRFVACGACGRGLTGSWTTGRSKRYAYYHCQGGCLAGRRARTALHDTFVALLDASRPTPAYAAAFRTSVLTLVREVRAETSAVRGAVLRRRAQHEDRLRVLEDAFLDRTIDRATFTRRRSEALELLANADSELATLSAEGLDAEALLSLAEEALFQGSRWWTTARTVTDRIRLQSAIYPDGLILTPSGELKPRNGRGFYELPQVDPVGSEVVDPSALNWHRISLWLSPWRALAEAGGAALFNPLR